MRHNFVTAAECPMRYTDELAEELVSCNRMTAEVRETWKHWDWIPDEYAVGAKTRTPLSTYGDRNIWRWLVMAFRSGKICRKAIYAAARITEKRGHWILTANSRPSLEEVCAMRYVVGQLCIAAQTAMNSPDEADMRTFFSHPALFVFVMVDRDYVLHRRITNWLGGKVVYTPDFRHKLVAAIQSFLADTQLIRC